MPDELSNAAATAQQVEFAAGRLDSLSTLPCTAAKFLPIILQEQFRPSSLADIIKSDPALTAMILSLFGRRGISMSGGRFSIERNMDRLPAHEVRDALLNTKVFLPDRTGISNKQELLLHAIAVACCAEEIAKTASPQIDSEMAYCAGLLHDIGKLALEEVMPKSFVRIIEEARSAKESSCTIEQEHLGADHTIIGKHLGQKWRLPNPIVLAVWLHHSETMTIAHNMPEARIAAVVQLADSIARQAGIGVSGSFDLPEPAEPIGRWLAINSEQIMKIRSNLREAVEKKSSLLGLDAPNAVKSYFEAARTATSKLARQQTESSLENRRLQSISSHLDFTKDFLLNTSSSVSVLDIAENFAAAWQKFYQTGTVCLYLVPLGDSQTLDVVVIEKLGQSRIISVVIPEETPVIPQAIANNFVILNAPGYIDWLFEQLDVEFDESRTRLLPLLSAGSPKDSLRRAVGAIAFEIFYPGDVELFEQNFRTSASMAGDILNLALGRQKQQLFAERFVRLISKAPDTQPQIDMAEYSIKALAEMAAGAAHELNNPLAVISGRAQLLADAETDKEKKEILEQIYKNAREASELIEDLMSFAEPRLPRPTRTDIKQLIEEAVQLTSRKTNREILDIEIEIAEDIKPVLIDSAQIVSAVANIISNAVESYSGQTGPIKITAGIDPSGESIKLIIKDQGCGMDTETLQKATQPFFSAKEAGRKRGMGLAYAARFIQLNKGTLSITSELGRGTTVNIYLPIG